MSTIFDYSPLYPDPVGANRPSAFNPLDMDEAIQYILGRGVSSQQAGLLGQGRNTLSNLYEGALRGYNERALAGGVAPLSVRTPTALEWLNDYQQGGNLTGQLSSILGSSSQRFNMPAFSVRRLRF